MAEVPREREWGLEMVIQEYSWKSKLLGIKYMYVFEGSQIWISCLKNQRGQGLWTQDESVGDGPRVLLIKLSLGLSSGTVAESPPVNAGVTGPTPGQGRFHIPWSN